MLGKFRNRGEDKMQGQIRAAIEWHGVVAIEFDGPGHDSANDARKNSICEQTDTLIRVYGFERDEVGPNHSSIAPGAVPSASVKEMAIGCADSARKMEPQNTLNTQIDAGGDRVNLRGRRLARFAATQPWPMPIWPDESLAVP
jgi:hypothetical protein